MEVVMETHVVVYNSGSDGFEALSHSLCDRLLWWTETVTNEGRERWQDFSAVYHFVFKGELTDEEVAEVGGAVIGTAVRKTPRDYQKEFLGADARHFL